MVGDGREIIKMNQDKPKENPLFENYKLLFNGEEEDLKRVPSSLVKPLIHWVSFSRNNIEICSLLNRYFMYVKSDILLWLLYWKLDVDDKYIKRLKPVYDNKLIFLRNYLKKYFNYSEREYLFYKKILDEKIKNNDVKRELNLVFGFSQEECKKLDITYTKSIKKRKDAGSQSLFNFVKR